MKTFSVAYTGPGNSSYTLPISVILPLARAIAQNLIARVSDSGTHRVKIYTGSVVMEELTRTINQVG